MSEIRCIIVEDEPLAVKVLTDYISEIPFLDLRGIFKDAILASDFLRDHKVDLIFLDMHLPRLKGMDFLKTLTNPPAVIVTSAYHQYAIEGFNHECHGLPAETIWFRTLSGGNQQGKIRCRSVRDQCR
jgi:two-component system, LytTR family, response regulator